MSFSPAWLALREPVDHAARAKDLAMEVAAHFAPAASMRVVDLGCGTGSNLRATALLLPAQQEWLLVDYDAALLAAAREHLAAWAEAAEEAGETLRLTIAGRQLSVRFLRADLSDGVRSILDPAPDLVTASALFDLVSKPWLEAFTRDVAAARAAFYTVLTYNGLDKFGPKHTLDSEIIAAFAAHQGGDKGFGPAAGPEAPGVMKAAFAAAGYAVQEGDSPWRIGIQNRQLGTELLRGIAGAVAETGRILPEKLEEWLQFRLAAAEASGGRIITGHTDTFAFPR